MKVPLLTYIIKTQAYSIQSDVLTFATRTTILRISRRCSLMVFPLLRWKRMLSDCDSRRNWTMKISLSSIFPSCRAAIAPRTSRTPSSCCCRCYRSPTSTPAVWRPRPSETTASAVAADSLHYIPFKGDGLHQHRRPPPPIWGHYKQLCTVLQIQRVNISLNVYCCCYW